MAFQMSVNSIGTSAQNIFDSQYTHIKKKSEAVTLIGQMALANQDQKVKIKEEVGKAKSGTHTFKINNTIFIVKRRVENNQKFIEINRLRELNRGLQGIVYDVHNINTKTCNQIVKLAIDNERAKKSMRNEIQMLQWFYGVVVGLQGAIDETIEFGNEIGYMTVKYLLDGCDEFPANADWSQLIKGLNWLKEKKVCHGDIKPDNIYYKEPNTLVLGDFGGARNIEDMRYEFINGLMNDKDIKIILSDLFGVRTKGYVSNKIIQDVTYKVEEFSRNKQKRMVEYNEYHELFDKMMEELFKSDEFALGISLCSMIVHEFPPFKSFTQEDKMRFTGQDETKEEIEKAIEEMRVNLSGTKVSEKLKEDVMTMIMKGF